MTEIQWSLRETDVIQGADERIATDADDVLATVVAVDGNAYRRPGAKMLLAEDADVGTITAGCLEDELRSAAARVRETGELEIVTYDMMDDDDVWGLGMGCNGIIEVLLEPLDETFFPAVEAFDAGRDVAILTVLSGDGERLVRGDRAYYDPDDDRLFTPDGRKNDERSTDEVTADGRSTDDVTADGRSTDEVTADGRSTDEVTADGRSTDEVTADGRSTDEVTADGRTIDEWPTGSISNPASELARGGRSDVITLDAGGSSLRIFVDGLAARPEVVVFGSGHDVGPVTELAAKNDFRVTVVGFRGAVDLETRFPGADRTISTSPATIEADLELDDRTYAVVMTHNFIDDRLAVETLLEADVPYVGLMGPRERFEEMVAEFEAEGNPFVGEPIESVYTPVGLDLGGGTPYQIAHSIVAEVLAVSNERAPGHLRRREGHIHERVDVD